MEHGSESYYVLGEGLLGESLGGREPTLARTAEAATPPFRFSRMGPKGGGKQIPEGARKALADAMAVAGGGSVGVPAGFTYLGQFIDHDLTFDKTRRDARGARRSDRAPPGPFAEPRPRLPLRRGPGRSRVGAVLRGRRAPPEDGQDRLRRRAGLEGRLRPSARRGLHRRGEAEGDHPRPAERREPRGRADPPRDDPLPQPRRRHARHRSRRLALRARAQAGDEALPVDDPHRLPAEDLRCLGRERRLHERTQGLRGRRGADRCADDADRVLRRRLPARTLDGARLLQLEQDLRRRLRHARPPLRLLGDERRPRRLSPPDQLVDRRLPAAVRLPGRRPRGARRAGCEVQQGDADRHAHRQPAPVPPRLRGPGGEPRVPQSDAGRTWSGSPRASRWSRSCRARASRSRS